MRRTPDRQESGGTPSGGLGARVLVALAVAVVTATGCSTARMPPQMSVEFPEGAGDWVHGFGRIDGTLAFVQMIPKGESMDSWTQSIVMQTIFVDAPVRAVADQFEAVQRQEDPAATATQVEGEDGSIVVESRSDKIDEMGIRKFMRGPDGSYSVGWLTRPRLYDEVKWVYWRKQISGAKLIPRLAVP